MNYFDPAFHITSPVDDSLITLTRSKIRAWISSNWLVDLVTLFDGKVTLQDPLDVALERLEIFSDRWDFRRIARERGAAADDNLRQGTGSARWLSAATELSPEMEVRVFNNAKHLGLVEAQEPTESAYDHIVVLGGARLSCKLRPFRAAEVMHAGVQVGSLALLGAARPIPDSERDATDTYAPGAVDEFDLIVAGAQQVFGFDPSAYREDRYDNPDNPNLSWIVRRFGASYEGRPLKIAAMSAPSSDPVRRRANSPDTIIFFLDREKVQPGERILLITSQIYVPYVQLEAIRTVALVKNVLVETIGFPGDRMPQLQGLSNANHYLQEVRSAIQAARRFCIAYPEKAS